MPPAPREFATVTADDLVTGEAVALDLPPAGLGVRMASGLIDLTVTVVLLLILLVVALIGSAPLDEALVGVVVTLVSMGVLVGFPAVLETLTRGRSLGKLALGLRTVREDAGPISFHHALVRALIGMVEIYLTSGVPAFFSMMLSTRGKRLGDYAAGTYVVRTRVPLQLSPPRPGPPHLAAWAGQADIASLPTGLTLAVRQYLGRAPSLDPGSRQRVGDRLAEDVSAYVTPLPPPGTSAEDFLAAVVAARRERDLTRMRRQAAFRDRLVGGGAQTRR